MLISGLQALIMKGISHKIMAKKGIIFMKNKVVRGCKLVIEIWIRRKMMFLNQIIGIKLIKIIFKNRGKEKITRKSRFLNLKYSTSLGQLRIW